MKTRASQTETGKKEAQPLVALPDRVEMHLEISSNAATEAEILDRLLRQQILALFESDTNKK